MNESAVYEIKLKDSFSRPLGSLEPKMNKFEGKVNGLKGSFNGLGESIAGAFAGGLVAGGIASLLVGLKDITVGIIQVTRDFTNLKEAIEFASGKDAVQNIKFLDETIEKLGLDMRSTYKGFKTFQGSLMGTALEGENGRKIFESLSGAAAVMKLSADDTEGAFLALGQMISKGTVSAEELRGQLGERLPGAFQNAAKAMGYTTKQLGDMLRKGEVVAEDFLPKFGAELEKTFGPGILKAQDSFNANMNRFNNFILRGKIAIGTALLPALNEFVSVIPKLDFSVFISQFSFLSDMFKEITGVMHDLFEAIGLDVEGFQILQGLVQYFSGILRLAFTPFRAYVAFITLVVDAIKAAVPVFEEFGKLLKSLFTLDFDSASDSAHKFKQLAIDFKNTMGGAIEDVINKEKQGWIDIFKVPGQDKKQQNAGATTGGTASGGLSPKASGKSSEGSGVEKITAGTRNITININKLVESVNIAKTFGRNSDSELVEAVKKALLTGVNDVNIMAQ